MIPAVGHGRRFEGKTVLVIGGNSGIGLASAMGFAEEGANRVLLTGRNPDTLASAARQVGERAVPLRFDISRMDGLESLAAGVRAATDRLDVLFVNAGAGAFVPIEEVTEALWDQLFATNLKGAFFTIQKLLPMMGQGGAIVLTSSIGHCTGIAHNSVYGASKAGLRSLARTLGAELVGRGIRVNCISPGPVETPIINRTAGLPPEGVAAVRATMIENTPMRRMGAPDEVARAALFLASDDASFITGVDLLVDGGIVSF